MKGMGGAGDMVSADRKALVKDACTPGTCSMLMFTCSHDSSLSLFLKSCGSNLSFLLPTFHFEKSRTKGKKGRAGFLIHVTKI